MSELNFAKVKRMKYYAKMLHPYSEHDRMFKALDGKYQQIDFDKVDKLYNVIKKYSDVKGTVLAETALSENFHKLDPN